MAKTKKKWASFKFSRKWLLIGVAAFLTVGFGCWKIYQNYQIQEEKKKFEIADASMGKLYDEILKAVGQPVDSYHEKSCHYSSVKYGKGALSCDVSYIAVFQIGGLKEANSFASKTHTVIQGFTQWFKSKGYQEQSTIEESEGKFGEVDSFRQRRRITEQGTEPNTDMLCGGSYSYFLASYAWGGYKDFNNLDSDKAILLHVSCGKAAQAEHYPVKE